MNQTIQISSYRNMPSVIFPDDFEGARSLETIPPLKNIQWKKRQYNEVISILSRIQSDLDTYKRGLTAIEYLYLLFYEHKCSTTELNAAIWHHSEYSPATMEKAIIAVLNWKEIKRIKPNNASLEIQRNKELVTQVLEAHRDTKYPTQIALTEIEDIDGRMKIALHILEITWYIKPKTGADEIIDLNKKYWIAAVAWAISGIVANVTNQRFYITSEDVFLLRIDEKTHIVECWESQWKTLFLHEINRWQPLWPALFNSLVKWDHKTTNDPIHRTIRKLLTNKSSDNSSYCHPRIFLRRLVSVLNCKSIKHKTVLEALWMSQQEAQDVISFSNGSSAYKNTALTNLASSNIVEAPLGENIDDVVKLSYKQILTRLGIWPGAIELIFQKFEYMTIQKLQVICSEKWLSESARNYWKYIQQSNGWESIDEAVEKFPDFFQALEQENKESIHTLKDIKRENLRYLWAAWWKSAFYEAFWRTSWIREALLQSIIEMRTSENQKVQEIAITLTNSRNDWQLVIKAPTLIERITKIMELPSREIWLVLVNLWESDQEVSLLEKTLKKNKKRTNRWFTTHVPEGQSSWDIYGWFQPYHISFDRSYDYSIRPWPQQIKKTAEYILLQKLTELWISQAVISFLIESISNLSIYDITKFCNDENNRNKLVEFSVEFPNIRDPQKVWDLQKSFADFALTSDT